MIYTDGVHLVSDVSIQELHNFAQAMDLNRCWFHHHKRRHPHYDLTTQARLSRALQMGAKRVSSREIVLKGRR